MRIHMTSDWKGWLCLLMACMVVGCGKGEHGNRAAVSAGIKKLEDKSWYGIDLTGPVTLSPRVQELLAYCRGVHAGGLGFRVVFSGHTNGHIIRIVGASRLGCRCRISGDSILFSTRDLAGVQVLDRTGARLAANIMDTSTFSFRGDTLLIADAHQDTLVFVEKTLRE